MATDLDMDLDLDARTPGPAGRNLGWLAIPVGLAPFAVQVSSTQTVNGAVVSHFDTVAVAAGLAAVAVGGWAAQASARSRPVSAVGLLAGLGGLALGIFQLLRGFGVFAVYLGWV